MPNLFFTKSEVMGNVTDSLLIIKAVIPLKVSVLIRDDYRYEEVLDAVQIEPAKGNTICIIPNGYQYNNKINQDLDDLSESQLLKLAETIPDIED